MINAEEGWTRQGQLAVGDIPELHCHLTAAHHDHATAGHLGIQRTISLVSQRYWWPGLREFIRNYVKGCATCQVTKAGTTKPRIPLFPIMAQHALISFSVIALDLIVDLPPLEGYDSILTITDHDCTKASLFFPCKQTITSQGIAALYAKHVFPHFGVPNRVISDRDTCFTSNFAIELCTQLDITQNISTAYHPQTDGQSERTNQWLEQYLRIYCNFQQDNWASLLPMAQFVHNSWPNSTTSFAPFELLIGAVPRFNITKGIVTDDHNHACTHSAKAKPEGSDEVRNCRCKLHEHDVETSHA